MKTIKLSTELLNTQTAGLDAALVEKIKADFAPYFEALKAEQETAFDLVVTSADQKDLMKAAGDKRKAAVKKRTGADDLRKGMKAGGLSYLDAIQKVFNALEKGFKEVEEHYRQQETFVERMEQIRIDELRKERNIELWPLKEFVPMGIDAGTLSDEDYAKILSGCKAAKAQKEREGKEAAEQAERNRLAEIERVKQAEKDRIQNEKLKKQLDKVKADKDKLEQEAEKLKEAAEQAEQNRQEEERQRNEFNAKRELMLKRDAELRPYLIFIRDYSATVDLPEDEYQAEIVNLKEALRLQNERDEEKRREKEYEAARIEASKNGDDETKLDDLQGKIKAILSDLPECTFNDGILTIAKVKTHLQNAVNAIIDFQMPF